MIPGTSRCPAPGAEPHFITLIVRLIHRVLIPQRSLLHCPVDLLEQSESLEAIAILDLSVVFGINFPHVVVEIQVLESRIRSEEHTSELQSQSNLVCRL